MICLLQCSALAASIIFTISILDYGFASGRPGVDKPTIFKFNIIIEICNIASTCLGRVAFILYLLPVLSIRKVFKISLWVLLTVQIAANTVMIILVLTQCRDIRGIWNPEYATDCSEDTIQLYFGYFLCGMSIYY
jgi:glucan phosphoethanolaminetransferase (alkaline phosphatase superfamily)